MTDQKKKKKKPEAKETVNWSKSPWTNGIPIFNNGFKWLARAIATHTNFPKIDVPCRSLV
jgi:hypothetical protein